MPAYMYCTMSYGGCEPPDRDAPQEQQVLLMLRRLISPGFMQQWKGTELR